MAQKSSIGLTVLWVFFIIFVVGKSLAFAIRGKSWLTGTKENASFLQRQEISHDIDDTMRTGRSGLGKRKLFEYLLTKRDDREDGLNGVKNSHNIFEGRDLRLYCRFRGKCNIAEKYKVSAFAFAADSHRDPQRHLPRRNFMKTKH